MKGRKRRKELWKTGEEVEREGGEEGRKEGGKYGEESKSGNIWKG